MNPKRTEHGHDASALATGNAIEILADVLAAARRRSAMTSTAGCVRASRAARPCAAC